MLGRSAAKGDEDDLARLLARMADGDRTACRDLYERTSAKLFGVALRIVRDRAVAEEVLQDVYLRIWGNAASYSADIARPMTWLIAIARNRAIDFARARRETLPAPSEDGVDWLERVPDPADPEMALAQRDALERCLGLLDDAQRSCIVLAYVDGYSREELAERFDRNISTVKTWLHRGLAALRNCLGAP